MRNSNNRTEFHGTGPVATSPAAATADDRMVFWPLVSGALLAAALGAMISTVSIHRSLTSAVEMLVPGVQAAERAFVEIERSRGLPVRGQSRDSVRNRYGNPVNSKSAVGDPPISSWSYADFTVYFEYDLVITSVASEDYLPTDLGDIQ